MRYKAVPLSVRATPRAERPSRQRPPSPKSSRTRDWALTLPIVLLVPIIMVPLIALAGGPQLSVGAGGIQPGGRVVVTGTNLDRKEYVELSWDGAPTVWLPVTKTDRNGTLTVAATLPATVTSGPHLVEARMKRNGPNSKVHPDVVARVTVTVLGPVPTAPPPAPTATAPAPPPATPTPTVTQPTATPAPSATAPPQSTASATPIPTVTAKPSTATPTMPPPSGDSRLTCAGYPEPRVFLETQDWWDPIPVLGGTGHVHLGTCFPLGQTVSGKVTFDVRVMLHDNLGSLVRVKMQDDMSTDHLVLKVNETPVTGGDHMYWYRVAIDTTSMPDGLRQFRWYADLEHANGNRQTARSSWPLDIENGKPDQNVTGAAAKTKFQNWYQVASPNRDWGYAGPTIDGLGGVLSGTVTFEAKCSVNGDSGAPAQSLRSVHVDPNFHMGMNGKILYQGSNTSSDITLDTRSLSNGPHKVVVRCRQDSGNEHHEGVGVFPIVVGN
ncbi:MAG: hypothetical protein ABIW50_02055 [Candidatus Limnocylindria bacterium]